MSEHLLVQILVCVVLQRLSVQQDLSRLRLVKSLQQSDTGGFSWAVTAHQGSYFAWIYLEWHVLEGGMTGSSECLSMTHTGWICRKETCCLYLQHQIVLITRVGKGDVLKFNAALQMLRSQMSIWGHFGLTVQIFKALLRCPNGHSHLGIRHHDGLEDKRQRRAFVNLIIY